MSQTERISRRAAGDRDILAEALDALEGHVVILDRDGTIVYENAAWRRFGEENGLAPGRGGIGVNYLATCDVEGEDGANARAAREGIMDILRGARTSFSFEYPCASPAEPRWFILRGSRFLVAGEVYVVLAHENITARHLAEDAIRSRHAELEAFNASVSHDLRAPLRRIQDLAADIAEQKRITAPEAQQVLDKIRAEAARARTLVEALLELSRATSAELSLQDVDISALATDASNALRAEDTTESVVEIQQGMRARGDPELLRIVLTALIANARKFSARVDAPRVEVGVTERDNVRVFYVKDNGIGFSQAEAGSLFQPFHRLSTAADFQGTGIGLATVRRIIERHRGRVWAESQEGKGATFWFTLG